jgi:hypothetical protein
MKLLKSLMIVALVVLGNVSANAGVVLSNLGQTGLENLDNLIAITQGARTRNAAGFKIEGPQKFKIDSVGVLLEKANQASTSVTMAIYTDNGGKPSMIKLAESAALIVTSRNVYQFEFSQGNVVNANSTYWAVLETGVGTLWAGSTDENPAPLNSPSLTFAGYRRTTTFNDGNWANFTSNPLGFSVFGTEYVPEPALTSLFCFGGIALIRRRVKK